VLGKINMEKLFRAKIPLREIKARTIGTENPIELDNRAFDIKDGNKKSLDYLDYSSTITKGTLAANGIIKLCPASEGEFMKHYGTIAPPIERFYKDEEDIPKEPCDEEEIENEWDNIFLARDKIEYY